MTQATKSKEQPCKYTFYKYQSIPYSRNSCQINIPFLVLQESWIKELIPFMLVYHVRPFSLWMNSILISRFHPMVFMDLSIAAGGGHPKGTIKTANILVAPFSLAFFFFLIRTYSFFIPCSFWSKKKGAVVSRFTTVWNKETLNRGAWPNKFDFIAIIVCLCLFSIWNVLCKKLDSADNLKREYSTLVTTKPRIEELLPFTLLNTF